MNIPEDLRYSREHEWVRVEDGKATVGITDYAQDALGDIVYVDLPSTGTEVRAGESFCEVESTKSVSEVYAPVSGTIVSVNEELDEAPQKINDDPYAGGWICVIELSEASEVDALLDASGYGALVDEA